LIDFLSKIQKYNDDHWADKL